MMSHIKFTDITHQTVCAPAAQLVVLIPGPFIPTGDGQCRVICGNVISAVTSEEAERVVGLLASADVATVPS